MTEREEFEKWLNTLDKQTLVTMAAKQARTIEELQAATKAAVPDDDEWATEWNERVGITDKRTQIQEIAAWLAKQDNGADSALILAFEREHAELLSLVKDLKACLLSMPSTDSTDVEFCIATLDKTNQIILKHSGS